MYSNEPSMHRPRSYYLRAVILVVLGLVIGLGLSVGFDLQSSSRAQRSGGSFRPTVSSAEIPESPFVAVVQKTLPAVVFVDVRKTSRATSGTPQDQMMRRFFGDLPHPPENRPTSGSGFIIDTEGHILTNNHVVSDAADISVTLYDKRTFKARLVGTDPGTDVAVIKIEGDNLPTLPLGDSDRIRVGDWAVAIGNPLGVLRGSVTVGIISAQGRSNLNIFGGTPDFQDFIQTDASINFGNSGGPLCNIRGEAIGINTAINPSGQGIGFAIPINLVRHVADQLVAHGRVRRAGLGVLLAELTPEIAEGFGIPSNAQGVLIQNVVEGTPAARAGLKRGDVVVEFNHEPVTDMAKFRLKVADTPSGTTVPVTVLRDDKRITLNVTLEERDKVLAANGAAPPSPEQPAEAAETFGGLKVRDLTGQEKSAAKVEAGVFVIEVEPGSVAEEADLQAGDVIEEVNRKPASSVAVFQRLLQDAQKAKKHAVLLVHSGNDTRYVALSLTK